MNLLRHEGCLYYQNPFSSSQSDQHDINPYVYVHTLNLQTDSRAITILYSSHEAP